MNPALKALQQRIAYSFKRPELLELAVTHPSYLQDNPDIPESNQRLEFLGDAVLQLALTNELFQQYPDEREGALSQYRATLTKGSYLSALALEIDLSSCLLLGKSEEDSGGRTKASALEDAFEALIAAIHLDRGFDVASTVIKQIYGPVKDRLSDHNEMENPKGRLQELVQPDHGNEALRYDVTATSGADHAREYEVTLFFNDRPIANGTGSSKKIAEEAAARLALTSWPDRPKSD